MRKEWFTTHTHVSANNLISLHLMDKSKQNKRLKAVCIRLLLKVLVINSNLPEHTAQWFDRLDFWNYQHARYALDINCFPWFCKLDLETKTKTALLTKWTNFISTKCGFDWRFAIFFFVRLLLWTWTRFCSRTICYEILNYLLLLWCFFFSLV